MSKISGLEDFERLSRIYSIPLSDIMFIELNRTGVWLEKKQVPIGFRVRFKCDEVFSQKPPLYFAVPVKNNSETAFFIDEKERLMFGAYNLGPVSCLEIDTCDCSYFRKDKRVLNLNSNRRGNCGGCAYCVHNYPIYDRRVLKDLCSISSKAALKNFLEEEIIAKNDFRDLSCLEQIAVVTGLFPSEKAIVRHIANVREVCGRLGFHGPIFFLGSELRTRAAFEEIKNYGPFSFCYAVDCFFDRKHRLARSKGSYLLAQIIETISWARESGFETAYSYVVGIDPIVEILKWTTELQQFVSRFPVVNIYQIQHPAQRAIIASGASDISYFLEVRKFFESVFLSTTYRPRNWENYRSLWTHWFDDETIPE